MPKNKGVPEAIINKPYASTVEMSIGSYVTQSVDLSPPNKYTPKKEWALRELNFYPTMPFLYSTRQTRGGVSFVWGVGSNEDTYLSPSMTSPVQHLYHKPVEFPSWTKVTLRITNSSTSNPTAFYADYLWSEW